MLIGVGSYPESGGWASINSANDIKLIKTALESQGFKAEHIAEISDSKATRQGILAAIKTTCCQRLKPGIWFIFNFQGMVSNDRTKTEMKLMDWMNVLFLMILQKFQTGIYEGENLITDDELNQNLTKIREKLDQMVSF